MRRNVVVLCLDSVRADTFAARATRLADLADVTVTGCRAASGWTVPSHASMLTGCLPHDHGAHALSPRYDAIDRAGTLTGDLDGHALGVSASPNAGAATGFDALFDEFHDVRRTRPLQKGIDVAEALDGVDGRLRRPIVALRRALTHDAVFPSLGNLARVTLDRAVRDGPFGHESAILDDGARTVTRVLGSRIPEAERTAPVLAFATLTEARAPLVDRRGISRGAVPRGWSSEAAGLTPAAVAHDPDEYVQELAFYRRLYAENVAYLDRLCAGLIGDLRSATQRETTVVVTADHGVNLLDDPDEPLFGHVGSLSEAVTHVPLVIVNPPDGYPPVVDGLVSHLGFRALIRGLADGETPDPTGGTVAAELIGVPSGEAEAAAGGRDDLDRVRRCLYPHADAKLCWDDRGDRVEYALDPDEPCRQTRITSGTGGAPAWAEAVFDESAAETYDRTRRGTTREGDAGEADA